MQLGKTAKPLFSAAADQRKKAGWPISKRLALDSKVGKIYFNIQFAI
jgi:hypothetical protein